MSLKLRRKNLFLRFIPLLSLLGSHIFLAAWSTDLVQRTKYSLAPFIHYVRVDHGGRHVLMAEELLHGPYVVARFQEVSRKTVAIMPSAA
jgi:hypothetical protein